MRPLSPATQAAGLAAAFLSFAFCLAAGAWLFLDAQEDQNVTFSAIGLYFIGQAFFAGPALALLSLRK